MKKWLVLTMFFMAAGAAIANGQAADCPANMVCLSRQAAEKALADSDRVKALESEIKAKDDAIAGIRGELNNMRIEFARVSGENTGLKSNAVQDRAIIAELLKYAKKRCIVSVCF